MKQSKNASCMPHAGLKDPNDILVRKDFLMNDFSALRDTSFYKCSHTDHTDIESFATAGLADGIHTVWGGIYPIDFMLTLKPGRPLVVYFNGAVPRDKYPTLPVLLGANMMTGFDASSIVISDAALHADPNLSLGWHAGTQGFDLPAAIRKVVDIVAKQTRASRLIFCGPSGGGFAAIECASHYPGSLCYVWNPQTDILQYSQSHVADYGKACFGLETIEECHARLPALIKSNLFDLLGRSASGGCVIYTQNLKDNHVIKHAKPLVEALSPETVLTKSKPVNCRIHDSLWYFSTEWGDGHVPPSGRQIRAILRMLINSGKNLPNMIKDGSLGPRLDEIFT